MKRSGLYNTAAVLLIVVPVCCGVAAIGVALSHSVRFPAAIEPTNPYIITRSYQPPTEVRHAPSSPTEARPAPTSPPPQAPAPAPSPMPTQPATLTPVPPSPIPAATQAPARPATIQTATATNLPQPAINPTIAAYAAQALIQTQAYSTALHSFYTLNQSASNDPQLMLDDEWKTNMVVALATMQISGERLANVESSAPELSKTRDYFSKIDAETKLMVANYARGIDNLDKDSINAAVRNMENINTYLIEAVKELQKVYGVP